jgi:NitT/TauT family transport system substrate-binding protein
MTHRFVPWSMLIVLLVAGSALTVSDVGGQGSTKVKVAEPLRLLSFAPVYVAIEKGYFKAEGLEIDLISGGGGPQANAALIAGEVDFEQTATPEVLKMIKSGQRLMVVSGINGSLTLQTVVSRKLADAKKVSPKDPLHMRVAALKGATLGAVSLGGAQELFLRYGMLLAGLSPKDVTVIRVGGGPAMMAAMENGQIDGFNVSPPTGRVVEERGTGWIWIDPDTVPEYRTMLWQVLLAKREYVEKNPKIAEGMARAVARGINYTRKHPDETAALVQGYFKGQPLTGIAAGVKDVIHTFQKDGLQSQQGWDNAAKPMQKLGWLEAIDTREGGFWSNRYIVNVPQD